MANTTDISGKVEDAARREASETLATKKEIVDALISYGASPESLRDDLYETLIDLLEINAETEIPGAILTDDGIELHKGDEPTSNAVDVDPDDFSTGSIDPRADTQTSTQEDVDANEGEGDMSAMDFTRDRLRRRGQR